MSIIDVIGTPVAQVLKIIHNGLSTVFEPGSGPAWGLSIVLLTVFVRLLLFPLFVKQIKSQRRMQELSPRIKELQKLHKGDRETLNTEMMKLYKDNNANPITGCLPLLLQLPVFKWFYHLGLAQVPTLILSVTFAMLYAFLPNTRVRWL